MLFQKKKPEEDTSSEERSIKLKSKPLEQKKEKRKPWGKKERIFIFLFLAVTALVSFGLAFVARRGKLPGIPKLDAPGLGLQQTVVLTKTQVPKDRVARDNEIIQNFSNTTAKLSGVYALSVIDLNSGDSFGVNQFETMQAASLMKLPVMSLLLKEASEGRINLDAMYTLKSADKLGGSGSLYSKPEGTQLTYRSLLEYMGKQSDNTALNIVKKKLGEAKISEFLVDIGMNHTDYSNNMTTPSDISLLLRKLYEGRVVPTQMRDLLFDDLTGTIYENHLVKGVPEGVRVAHKYGKEVHVVNDAGIVFAESPYVVVIMTDGVVEPEADSIFPELSKIVYDGQIN